MEIIETNLKQNGQLSYGNNPSFLVLHNADASNCSIEDINDWHLQNGWTMCGYHFFVRKDGSIYRGRPENAIGSHCLHSNTNSLGICAEGNYMTETMPIEQELAIVRLCKYLCDKYRILKNEIYGHNELFATECPGHYYPLDRIKDLTFTEIIIEEEEEMKEVVLYSGDADVFSAIMVAQKMRCPLMKLEDFKSSGLTAKNKIQIGGPSATIGGADRFETFKNAGGLV